MAHPSAVWVPHPSVARITDPIATRAIPSTGDNQIHYAPTLR